MLLDDIMDIVTDQTGSLEAALLKTKVLLQKIGNTELVSWVDNELKGYPDDAELPAYRIVSSSPHGHLTSWAWQVQDWVLPTSQLTERQREAVRQTKVTSTIGTIEKQVQSHREKGTSLIRQLPPEFIPAFQKALEKGVSIMSVWCTINMADMEGIPIQVRARLLDFCLALQGEMGTQTPITSLQPAQPKPAIQAIEEQPAIHVEELSQPVAADVAKSFQATILNQGGNVYVGTTNIQINNTQGDDLPAFFDPLIA